MSFRQQATKLIGRTVQVQMNGHTLSGRMSSVGSDFMVMHTRIGRRIRRVNIRLAEILFLFLLF